MILEIAKRVDFERPLDVIWRVVRDPVVVAGCVPNVQGFAERRPGSFDASIHDKLGPFTVDVPVTIDVREDESEHRMSAAIAGSDKRGNARVRGEVTATVAVVDTGARLELVSHIEVLGRLAALGAVPMRRRADQIFEVFVRNISDLLRDSSSAVEQV